MRQVPSFDTFRKPETHGLQEEKVRKMRGNLSEWMNKNKKALIISGAAVAVLATGLVGGSMLLGDHNADGNKPGSSSVTSSENNKNSQSETDIFSGMKKKDISTLDSFRMVLPVKYKEDFIVMGSVPVTEGVPYVIQPRTNGAYFISENAYDGKPGPACDVKANITSNDTMPGDTVEDAVATLYRDKKVTITKVDDIRIRSASDKNLYYTIPTVKVVEEGSKEISYHGFAVLPDPRGRAHISYGCMDTSVTRNNPNDAPSPIKESDLTPARNMLQELRILESNQETVNW